MIASVFLITDCEVLSDTASRYLLAGFGRGSDVLSRTYQQRSQFPATFYRDADLLVFGLFRRDDIGFRAEGLLTAIARTEQRRRSLVISGCALANHLDCPWYWDLSSNDTMMQRVYDIMDRLPPTASEYALVRDAFSEYCRPAVDNHPLATLSGSPASAPLKPIRAR